MLRWSFFFFFYIILDLALHEDVFYFIQDLLFAQKISCFIHVRSITARKFTAPLSFSVVKTEMPRDFCAYVRRRLTLFEHAVLLRDINVAGH